MDFLVVHGILLIDTIAAIIAMYLVIAHPDLKILERFGVLIIVCGLIGQAARNLIFIQTGVSPTDLEMPFWILKDYGVSFLIFYSFGTYLFKAFKEYRNGG